jgi:hypothetical protein
VKTSTQKCQQRIQYLMVDVVVNHNAWMGNVKSIDFSKFSPFNKITNYHFPHCVIDYSDVANMVCLYCNNHISHGEQRVKSHADNRYRLKSKIAGLRIRQFPYRIYKPRTPSFKLNTTILSKPSFRPIPSMVYGWTAPCKLTQDSGVGSTMLQVVCTCLGRLM